MSAIERTTTACAGRHLHRRRAGSWEYTVEAWIDRFAGWRRDLGKKSGRPGRHQRAARRGRVGPADPLAAPRRGPTGCAARRCRVPRCSAPTGSGLPSTRRWRRSWPAMPTAPAVRPTTAVLKAGWTANSPGSAPVRTLPALLRDERAGTARSATSRSGCPTSPRWASTCCTCRRSTRSAAPQGREQQRSPRARRPRQPVGDRGPGGRPQGGRPPELGTLEDFDHLVAAAPRARHRDRAGHRLPVLPRPPLRRGAPGVVPPPAATARSSTPRTRPRSTRTSTRSTSSATTGRASGHELRTSSCSGPTAACKRLPGGQPAHQAVPVLGVADRGGPQGYPDAIFLVRGVHPAAS